MKNFVSVLLVAASLSACAGWSNPIARLTPHTIPVQQGNVINQEMLAKLKPGMNPSQVRFALGTPLVVDPFRKDRWDYVYHFENGGKVVERRRVTVIFEDGLLKGIEGDVHAAPAQTGAAK